MNVVFIMSIATQLVVLIFKAFKCGNMVNVGWGNYLIWLPLIIYACMYALYLIIQAISIIIKRNK